MKKQNFLLGRGERLTSDIVIRSGGAPKEAPYTFAEARERLAPMLEKTVADVNRLPADACPNDQAVILLTLNPEYLAKSYFPQDLFSQVGLELLGSRPEKIKPEKRSRQREPEETISTQLFASAPRSVLRNWDAALGRWAENNKGASDLVGIEKITAPIPQNKIKGVLPKKGDVPLEVVLHASELEPHIIESLWAFLRAREIPGTFKRRFFAQGLCFLEITAPAERALEIATFSPVRVLRKMPQLRFLRPTIRSSGIPSISPQLPQFVSLGNSPSVAIFDGGVPTGHPITQWVTPFEFPGMPPATEELLEHGVGVSSAALFGHIDPRLPTPVLSIGSTIIA